MVMVPVGQQGISRQVQEVFYDIPTYLVWTVAFTSHKFTPDVMATLDDFVHQGPRPRLGARFNLRVSPSSPRGKRTMVDVQVVAGVMVVAVLLWGLFQIPL